MASRTYRILHLTDTHLFADDTRHYGKVDTYSNLQNVLDRAAHIRQLDVVAVTGDISEDGTAESYRKLRALIDPWAAERGAITAFCMGNHDKRSSFKNILGNGLDDGDTGTDSSAPIFASTRVNGLRVIVLDTSVPQAGGGKIEPEQMDWLREALSGSAEHGTIVLMHHPPVPAQTSLLQALALQEPETLGQVLADSDVRLILAGHYHYPVIDSWRVTNDISIPVVVSAGVTNLADSIGDPAVEIATQGAGGTLIQLTGNGGHRILPFHVPMPESDSPVLSLDAEAVARIAKTAGLR